MSTTLDIDDCRLILGDALDVLDTIENESFDAAITDPPFGIGFKYNKKEKNTDPVAYWNWLEPIYDKMLLKVKPGGFVAVWQTQLYYKHFWEWFGDDIHIYASCKNFVQLRSTEINYGYDPIIMFYKQGEPLKQAKPKRSIDFFIAKKLVDIDENDWFLANTAIFITRTDDIARKHPCPRPIDQVETIVDNFTVPGGSVLDPFMGSATAGIACLKHGIKFTGIEIDEAYYNVARERIIEFVQRQKSTGSLKKFVH